MDPVVHDLNQDLTSKKNLNPDPTVIKNKSGAYCQKYRSGSEPRKTSGSGSATLFKGASYFYPTCCSGVREIRFLQPGSFTLQYTIENLDVLISCRGRDRNGERERERERERNSERGRILENVRERDEVSASRILYSET